MNRAFHLFRLQQIDTQIDQTLAKLQEIDRLLADDEAVRQAQKTADELNAALRQASQNLRQLEFAVKEQQLKIAQSETILYSGKVRNPKELQDLQKEIASFKNHLAALEDQQLDAMLAQEELQAHLDDAQATLAQTRASYVERSAGWLGQKEQLNRGLERLQTERVTAVSPVSAEDLKTYESIRKRKSGVAVTSVKDGSCAVCGAAIRPSELQTARSAQELVFCSTCGRILYSG